MSFQLPPAIAGDRDEVDASSEGVRNVAYVTGGLTIAAIAASVAWRAKDMVMDQAGEASESAGISFKGEI